MSGIILSDDMRIVVNVNFVRNDGKCMLLDSRKYINSKHSYN